MKGKEVNTTEGNNMLGHVLEIFCLVGMTTSAFVIMNMDLSSDEVLTGAVMYVSVGALVMFSLLTGLPVSNHYFVQFFIHGVSWVPGAGPNPDKVPTVPEKNIMRFFGYACASLAMVVYAAAEASADAKPATQRAVNGVMGSLWTFWFLAHIQSIVINSQPISVVVLNLGINLFLAVAHFVVMLG